MTTQTDKTKKVVGFGANENIDDNYEEDKFEEMGNTLKINSKKDDMEQGFKDIAREVYKANKQAKKANQRLETE